jgi:hypothetical protein
MHHKTPSPQSTPRPKANPAISPALSPEPAWQALLRDTAATKRRQSDLESMDTQGEHVRVRTTDVSQNMGVERTDPIDEESNGVVEEEDDLEVTAGPGDGLGDLDLRGDAEDFAAELAEARSSFQGVTAPNRQSEFANIDRTLCDAVLLIIYHKHRPRCSADGITFT